jgi:hypothetical protein
MLDIGANTVPGNRAVKPGRLDDGLGRIANDPKWKGIHQMLLQLGFGG